MTEQNDIGILLKQLTGRFGAGLLSDRRRLEGLLVDICGDKKKEISILLAAVKALIPEELAVRAASAETDSQRVIDDSQSDSPVLEFNEISELAERLRELGGFDKRLALWAVQTLAFALGYRVKSPAPSAKGEDRVQRTEFRGQKTEDRIQRTEDRGQNSEGRGQKTEDREQNPADQDWKLQESELITDENGSSGRIGSELDAFSQYPLDIAFFSYIEAHEGQATAVACSPDGTLLASGGRDSFVRLFSLPDLKPIHSFGGHDFWTLSLAFSSDSLLLASGGESIRIHHALEGTLLFQIDNLDGIALCVSFSPDNSSLLYGCSDGSVHLRYLNAFEQDYFLYAHTDSVFSISFSPDGRMIASGGRDRTVIYYDTFHSSILDTHSLHSDWVFGVSFSPDGSLLASCGSDDHVFVKEYARTKEHPRSAFLHKPTILLHEHCNVVMSCAFLNETNLVSAGLDGKTVIWDINQSSPICIFRLTNAQINAFAIHASQRIIFAALDSGGVVIFRVLLGPQPLQSMFSSFASRYAHLRLREITKDEFESSQDFSDRIRALYTEGEKKYVEVAETFIRQKQEEFRDTITKSEKEVILPLERIGKYNADEKILFFTIMKREYRVRMLPADAKSMKECTGTINVYGRKRLSADLRTYLFLDLKLKHPVSGTLYSVSLNQ